MEFKDLLKETKLLDFKSKSRIEESEQHMKDLVEILKVWLDVFIIILQYR